MNEDIDLAILGEFDWSTISLFLTLVLLKITFMKWDLQWKLILLNMLDFILMLGIFVVTKLIFTYIVLQIVPYIIIHNISDLKGILRSTGIFFAIFLTCFIFYEFVTFLVEEEKE